jgi:phenylalanyl-tRNA synthetase alpha chain
VNPEIAEHPLWIEASEGLSRIHTGEDLKQLRARFLGKNGKLTVLLRELKDLPVEERKKRGAILNALRDALEELFRTRGEEIALLEKPRVSLDLSLPGRGEGEVGGYHPLEVTTRRILSSLNSLGFSILEGPECESEWYNFSALNFPEDHPAREMQDTFFLEGKDPRDGSRYLLRTHTSSVQVRAMERFHPPMRIAVPGKVYRRDDDPTHSPVFHQIEGFWVDQRVTFGDLKGVIVAFLNRVFGDGVAVRFRPSFFPFTEPSAEVDMGCVLCDQKGCRVCKGSGWLEVMGCGMIHPQVLKNGGIDPRIWQGFAFGLGVERMAMILFQIPDIRLFYQSELPFLRIFSGISPLL